jgi:hypothetical protein
MTKGYADLPQGESLSLQIEALRYPRRATSLPARRGAPLGERSGTASGGAALPLGLLILSRIHCLHVPSSSDQRGRCSTAGRVRKPQAVLVTSLLQAWQSTASLSRIGCVETRPSRIHARLGAVKVTTRLPCLSLSPANSVPNKANWKLAVGRAAESRHYELAAIREVNIRRRRMRALTRASSTMGQRRWAPHASRASDCLVASRSSTRSCYRRRQVITCQRDVRRTGHTDHRTPVASRKRGWMPSACWAKS